MERNNLEELKDAMYRIMVRGLKDMHESVPALTERDLMMAAYGMGYSYVGTISGKETINVVKRVLGDIPKIVSGELESGKRSACLTPADIPLLF